MLHYIQPTHINLGTKYSTLKPTAVLLWILFSIFPLSDWEVAF